VWQARRDYTRLVTCGFTAHFLYLLVAAAWFRPWYMLWPVALGALLPGTWFMALVLAIALFASFPDLVEQYRVHWGWINADFGRRLVAPVLVAFWPPFMVWCIGLFRFQSWHFDAPWRTPPPGGGGSPASGPTNEPPV
jgi:hypothetical protein